MAGTQVTHLGCTVQGKPSKTTLHTCDQGAQCLRGGRAPAYMEKHGGEREAEEAFAAVCNARVVKGAEAYYRNMFFRCGAALACRLRLTGILQHHCKQLRQAYFAACLVDLQAGKRTYIEKAAAFSWSSVKPVCRRFHVLGGLPSRTADLLQCTAPTYDVLLM